MTELDHLGKMIQLDVKEMREVCQRPDGSWEDRAVWRCGKIVVFPELILEPRWIMSDRRLNTRSHLIVATTRDWFSFACGHGARMDDYHEPGLSRFKCSRCLIFEDKWGPVIYGPCEVPL